MAPAYPQQACFPSGDKAPTGGPHAELGGKSSLPWSNAQCQQATGNMPQAASETQRSPAGQGQGLQPPGDGRGCCHPPRIPHHWDCHTPLTFGVQQLAVSVHVRQEEAVDQGGLAQPGFPWDTGTRVRGSSRYTPPPAPWLLGSRVGSVSPMPGSLPRTCHHEGEVEALLH